MSNDKLLQIDVSQIKSQSEEEELTELNQVKDELHKTKKQLNYTKDELNQTKVELNQTRVELDQTKVELNQTKIELNQTRDELKYTKIELDQTKKELNQMRKKYEQSKSEQSQESSNHPSSGFKQFAHSIIVGGYDKYNHLGIKPNSKDKSGSITSIRPPQESSIDPSQLLSFSSYYHHSVLVTRSGLLLGAGDNCNGRISSTLMKIQITQFTEFHIKDESGHNLEPVSAVCTEFGTLYMFKKSSGIGRQLVYCDCSINGGNPVFLDIGDEEPVSLFGGNDHVAAISEKGEVIFINRNSVQNSPSSRIQAVSLPEGEKAASVACLNEVVVVLSSNGRLFSSHVTDEEISFLEVKELAGEEIVCVSGTYENCLAVSKKGHVFGFRFKIQNDLDTRKRISSFRLIRLLVGYKIRAAYAGRDHSLFETREGKIVAFGCNYFGQLLLRIDSYEDILSPTETEITGHIGFCIAGNCISVVFIGGSPPPNTPNRSVLNH